MRRKDRELTNKADVEAVLNTAVVCHLGLVDGDKPYVVPMNFAYEDGHIYLHGAAQGRKLDLIRKNNNVCFQMETFRSEVVKPGDEPCDWGTSFRSVIGTGKAILVEDLEEKRRALNIIVRKIDDRPFELPEAMVAKTAVIDITIEEMTGKMAND